MAKRLTRAKQKITQAGIPYRVPPPEELPARLAGVLATVYLVFNEGYAASDGQDLVRRPLVDEAMRLGRLLRALMPDEASVAGLLALMLLHDSRSTARVDDHGRAVALHEQDRTLWDHAMIREGVTLTGEALRRCGDIPDAYVVQAAIAACHAIADEVHGTDWNAVISWYDVLLAIRPGPAERLGRASAIAERDGAERGLVEVEAIDGLAGSPWWHAARAELLRRLGRRGDASAALERAITLGLGDAYVARLRHLIDG
jgi:RNA polymerase sigma-70 factor (ECF subfamily)